ncbi:hypothetical protein JCM14469_29470 [Desulfatiferula olefinivorans]
MNVMRKRAEVRIERLPPSVRRGAFALMVGMMLALAACSSGSGDGSAPAVNSGGAGSVLLNSGSGGAISATASDGTLVTLDVPSGALAQSQTVSLSLTHDPAPAARTAKSVAPAPMLTITITPSLDLLVPATVTVLFPETLDPSGMVLCRIGDDAFPLKQGTHDGMISGTIYSLGDLVCTRLSDGDLIDAAYDLINGAEDGPWQEAFASFDGLLWLSDALSRSGYPVESSECLTALLDKSRAHAEAFVATVGTVSKDSAEAVAVDMFRRLMVLCENPDNLIARLSALIPTNE